MIGPTQKGVRLRGGVKFDGALIELRREFQIALHLQPVGVLVEFLRHLDSRICHGNVIYVSKTAGPIYNAFMSSEIVLTPIGVVKSEIKDAVDDIWGGVTARIELDASRFTPDSLMGLGEFSHVEVLFLFDRVKESQIQYQARRPRGREDWPMTGIFAQRGKNRPNRLGVTVCRLISVNDLTVTVEGLDAVDGTPVLDIKPYIAEFAPRGPVRQPEWATKLMAAYWTVM
jgi:tRNA-Thr(GGU) m(6)t(6)A37 methyltransferase TsaA